jgi:hypothetical protein
VALGGWVCVTNSFRWAASFTKGESIRLKLTAKFFAGAVKAKAVKPFGTVQQLNLDAAQVT